MSLLIALAAAALMGPPPEMGAKPVEPPAAQAAPAAAACAHHEFDFWIGRWDVFDTKTGERAGSSLIERVYNGCALRENWVDPELSGGSLNAWSELDGRWHQTWTDSSGAWREFVGGLENGGMVLVWTKPSTKAPAGHVLVRMTFTPNPDGSVRQYSDYSGDDGQTWRERYDYTYRPAK